MSETKTLENGEQVMKVICSGREEWRGFSIEPGDCHTPARCHPRTLEGEQVLGTVGGSVCIVRTGD